MSIKHKYLIVHTARFWNNFHLVYIRSKTKEGKDVGGMTTKLRLLETSDSQNGLRLPIPESDEA